MNGGASLRQTLRRRGCFRACDFGIIFLSLLLVACSPEPARESPRLTLPAVEPADLSGRKLQVVATTSIIGDVVSQVGGSHIELATLIAPGQDPHAYEPAAQDLTAVVEADVIFINGWDLEESLVEDLAAIGSDVPLVPISAGIEPLLLEDDVNHDEGAHGAAVDPHVWFAIDNVSQWTANVATILAALDPANTVAYESRAAAYQTELEGLKRYVAAELAQIPAANRLLVTNHDSLTYLAHDYEFTILGTVIPGVSSVAEPAANELATLITMMAEQGSCTIFTETTVSAELAETVAAELSDCPSIQVVPLYTGALGPAGSGADSYIGMYRANVEAIVAALR